MIKYEYKTVHSFNLYDTGSSVIDTDYLNSLGEDGWKLISIFGEEAIFVKEIKG